MRCALKGQAPLTGPYGEALTGERAERAGKPLSYNGFSKARKECHRFDRTYAHNQICEVCLAERPNKHGDPAMTFKNFFPGAAHLMTGFTHEEYLEFSTYPSPWQNMAGFHVNTCFRDPMHVIYLGTAKDLLASCLGLWCRHGHVPGSNLSEQLRWVSAKQKSDCKAAGVRATFKTFTPANTGLDTRTQYPELGSSFKAATVKTSIWFFAKFANEICESSPEDWGPKTVGLSNFAWFTCFFVYIHRSISQLYV